MCLLATLPYTSSFHSISNRGKWKCSNRIGALPPWPEVHRSCCKGMSACVRPGLHLVEWSRSQVELSRISVSLEFECFLEKMGMSYKVRRFYFFRHFFILHFSNYLNVFSLMVISIMTLCIPKLSLKKIFFFLYNI